MPSRTKTGGASTTASGPNSATGRSSTGRTASATPRSGAERENLPTPRSPSSGRTKRILRRSVSTAAGGVRQDSSTSYRVGLTTVQLMLADVSARRAGESVGVYSPTMVMCRELARLFAAENRAAIGDGKATTHSVEYESGGRVCSTAPPPRASGCSAVTSATGTNGRACRRTLQHEGALGLFLRGRVRSAVNPGRSFRPVRALRAMPCSPKKPTPGGRPSTAIVVRGAAAPYIPWSGCLRSWRARARTRQPAGRCTRPSMPRCR